MSGKTKLRVVVFMASPELVAMLDRISDAELCSRSEVIRRRMEKVAAAWGKKRSK